MSEKTELQIPLAVIGVGCLFPKAGSLRDFWGNIKGKVDAIGEVPPSHWKAEDYFEKDPKAPDMTYARRGGFLDPVDFDPSEFGVSPATLEATDSAQLLSLVAAQMALNDAGYGAGRDFDRNKVSVILGVTGTLELVVPLGARLGHPIWRKALKEHGIEGAEAESIIASIKDGYVPWQENSFPGLLGNVVAGRVANRFNLGGTNCVVDAACASSLSATHLAALELSARRSSMVVTGGVDCFNDIFMYMCFSKTPALSASGDIKPFDKKADGTMLGEGLGMVVLKRLDDAQAHGDKIYCVLKGVGSSSDGRGKSIYAPSAEGQAKALKKAYEISGVSPDTVELVEAHGTGTSVGDAAEVSALKEVYAATGRGGKWCALGSVKSMIGHTKAAAGSAALIKAAMSLRHKVLPPTIKVTDPNAAVEGGPFYVNTEKRPWVKSAHPRRAAVSALGFGGSNFHAVLEEYRPEKTEIDWDGRVQLVAFSGASAEEVQAKISAWRSPKTWDEVCVAAAGSRAAFDPSAAARLALVVEKGGDLSKLISSASAALAADAGKTSWSLPDGAYFGSGPAVKTAALFSGQGSQYVGMGRDLFCQFPRALSALEAAVAAFDGPARLSDLMDPPPAFTDAEKAAQENALRSTDVAQPALGATALAMHGVLSDFGFSADAFAGHSYGELPALRAAGRIDDDALFALSALRGRLMAAGDGGRGGMLAVMCSAEEAQALLDAEKLDVVVANKNAPAQSVLSGTKENVARAAELFAAKDIRVVPLPVSAAFHSALVAGAAKPFGEALSRISLGRAGKPVYANKTAQPYPADAGESRALLASQLASPVEWVRLIENMHLAGVRAFVEVGPGARLTGLVSRILDGKEHAAFAVDASGGKRSGILDLARALAQLAALGRPIKLDLWEGGEAAARLLEKKKGKMSVTLTGANYRSTKPSGKEPVKIAWQAPAAAAATAAAPRSFQGFGGDAVRAAQESLNALQRLQEQTAQLHLKFLETQEAAQRQFQALIEQQQRLFSGAPLPAVPAPVFAPAPASVAPRAPEHVAFVAAAPAPAAAPVSSPASNVESVLLAVVAEKTGYPVETLNPTMDLESDLGIDSIKRVEILSAIQEKLPGAPKVKPEHLGTLRTLKLIVEFLSAGLPAQTPAAAPAAVSASNVESVLLAVVAEKTGYPVETLNPTMDLESDLGIDSIKRVEILSALQEKLPGAPKVKPEHLGALRTLKSIVEFLSQSAASPVSPSAKSEISPESAAAPSVLKRLLIKAAPFDGSRESLSLAPLPVWVCGDASLGKDLAAALKKKGIDARVAALDAALPEALAGLVIAAPARKLSADALWDEGSERILLDALLLTGRAAPALRAGAARGGALFSTVTRLDGRFGLDGVRAGQDPVLGGLAGLAKTAAREWPEVSCKAIDAAAGWDQAAEAVAAELLLKGPVEIGLSASGAKAPVEEEAPAVEPGALPLSDGDLVIVTGGARGVTVEAAAALAFRKKLTLALLGRSPRPVAEDAAFAACRAEAELKKAIAAKNPGLAPKAIGELCRKILAGREIAVNLARLEKLGARVVYAEADLCDAKAAAKAVADLVAAHGPVRALVHGAGVLADKLIAEKTEASAGPVLATKLAGLRHLLAALDLSALKAVALFSSSTARYGRVGQSDYALANEALNKIAQLLAQRLGGCRVVSVGWGPWDGGMVNDGLKKLFAAEGVGVIGLAAGGNFLADELSGPCRVAEVVVVAVPAAASAAEAPPELSVCFERNLTVDDYPFLRSHVINGRAVLPVAMIAEWFAHAALHGNPGLVFSGLSGLRVQKGVLLEEGKAYGVSLWAGKAARGPEGFRVPVVLRGESGAQHASAQVLLAAQRSTAPAAAAEVALRPYPRTVERAYAEVLFHGPELRGIRRVLGVSEKGISCEAAPSLPPAQWARKPLRDQWLADPMALDAAFQAMILWTQEQAGAPSLPTYLKDYRQFRAKFPDGGVVVRARVTKSVDGQAVADMDFVDGSGALVARVEGYECAVDSSLAGSFRRNELVARAA